jgi:acyl-CoA synthetase (AMP-forming)/AMP-acid ligase II
MGNTLQSSIYELAEADPDAKALGFYSADRTCAWMSRGELVAGAEAAASRLSDMGLVEGSVCVQVPYNDRFAAEVLLGTLVLGALPLLVAPPAIQGLNSSLPDILHGIIERTSAPVVVAADTVAGMREDLMARHPGTTFAFGAEEFESAGGRVDWVMRGSDDLAGLQLTSGTTGFPRICMWRQQNVMAALDGMATAMDVSSDDVYLNWTPLYHDMGLMNNFMLCLTRGIPLVMMSPFDFVKRPVSWMRGVFDTGATITWSPNFGFALAAQRVRASEMEGITLDHVRGFWNAAERIHYETIVAFKERFTPFGLRADAVKTNFGCAENVGGATFTPPHEEVPVEHIDASALHEDQVAAVVAEGESSVPTVGCGKAHPGITIHILDDVGRDLPDGHVGHLALDTASRMEGYLHDPEATAAAFHGDLLKTGDLGYLRDGEFFWTGRAKERIAVRGRKIDPSDFEAALLKIPDLRTGSFAAFGTDDAKLGTQRVVIISEVRDERGQSADEITAAVKQAVFERLGVGVDDVVLVSQGTLTKTSSGKRRHRHFAEMYERGQLAEYEIA